MKCSHVKELLSAYYDEALVNDQRIEVSTHLETCEECTKELAAYKKLSGMAKALTTPAPPKHIWNELERQLDSNCDSPEIAEPEVASRQWSFPTRKLMALAATLLLAVSVGWIGYHSWFGHGEHDQFTVEFGQYLDEFHVNPDSAQQFLLAKYENRLIDPNEEIGELGYRPAVAMGMPEGYSLQSTYVMKMPCCTCVQCVCQRSDGTTIAIFEHDDEETKEWFGERPEMSVTCNGSRCSLVELDDRIAASWKLDKRHITVVGIRDVAELTALVAWFDDRKKQLAL